MKKYGRSLRIVSLIVIHSFLLEQLSFAAPAIPSKLDLFAKPNVDLGIPASVATIEDAWFASAPKGKTVYLIQDAHTNFSGQLNVAKALDLLIKEKTKYVFLEAGSGDESLSFLRKYADLKDRQRLSECFLRQARLQGSEYFDLTSDREFVLWGVEALPLYAKSVEAYRQVVKDREKFQTYLNKIQTAIEALKPMIYDPALLSFDGDTRRFRKEELSLTDYFEVLTTQAQIYEIPLKNYPHLSKLRDLKAEENKIDFKKASEEQVKAVEALPEAAQKELLDLAEKEKKPFKLSGNDHKEDKAFYTLLEEKLKGQKFPELSKYFAYLKEAKSLDPAKLIEEQKALETEIFQALAQRPDELNLVWSSKRLEILKKLLGLTLTPDEWETYEKDRRSFDIKTMTGFLNKKIMDLHSHYDRAVFLEEGYEGTIQRADEFYGLTYSRDQKFVENTLKKMDQENQTHAVLITGGFHSPNLKYLLKQKNVSFVNITPQVFQETDQARYEQILMGQMDKLKKASASIETIPAFATNFMSANTANALRIDDVLVAAQGLSTVSLGLKLALTQEATSAYEKKLIRYAAELKSGDHSVISSDPARWRGNREISAPSKTITAARLANSAKVEIDGLEITATTVTIAGRESVRVQWPLIELALGESPDAIRWVGRVEPGNIVGRTPESIKSLLETLKHRTGFSFHVKVLTQGKIRIYQGESGAPFYEFQWGDADGLIRALAGLFNGKLSKPVKNSGARLASLRLVDDRVYEVVGKKGSIKVADLFNRLNRRVGSSDPRISSLTIAIPNGEKLNVSQKNIGTYGRDRLPVGTKIRINFTYLKMESISPNGRGLLDRIRYDAQLHRAAKEGTLTPDLYTSHFQGRNGTVYKAMGYFYELKEAGVLNKTDSGTWQYTKAYLQSPAAARLAVSVADPPAVFEPSGVIDLGGNVDYFIKDSKSVIPKLLGFGHHYLLPFVDNFYNAGLNAADATEALRVPLVAIGADFNQQKIAAVTMMSYFLYSEPSFSEKQFFSKLNRRVPRDDKFLTLFSFSLSAIALLIKSKQSTTFTFAELEAEFESVLKDKGPSVRRMALEAGKRDLLLATLSLVGNIRFSSLERPAARLSEFEPALERHSLTAKAREGGNRIEVGRKDGGPLLPLDVEAILTDIFVNFDLSIPAADQPNMVGQKYVLIVDRSGDIHAALLKKQSLERGAATSQDFHEGQVAGAYAGARLTFDESYESLTFMPARSFSLLHAYQTLDERVIEIRALGLNGSFTFANEIAAFERQPDGSYRKVDMPTEVARWIDYLRENTKEGDSLYVFQGGYADKVGTRYMISIRGRGHADLTLEIKQEPGVITVHSETEEPLFTSNTPTPTAARLAATVAEYKEFVDYVKVQVIGIDNYPILAGLLSNFETARRSASDLSQRAEAPSVAYVDGALDVVHNSAVELAQGVLTVIVTPSEAAKEQVFTRYGVPVSERERLFSAVLDGSAPAEFKFLNRKGYAEQATRQTLYTDFGWHRDMARSTAESKIKTLEANVASEMNELFESIEEITRGLNDNLPLSLSAEPGRDAVFDARVADDQALLAGAVRLVETAGGFPRSRFGTPGFKYEELADLDKKLKAVYEDLTEHALARLQYLLGAGFKAENYTEPFSAVRAYIRQVQINRRALASKLESDDATQPPAARLAAGPVQPPGKIGLLVVQDKAVMAEEIALRIVEKVRQKPGVTLGFVAGRTMEAVFAEILRIFEKDPTVDFSQVSSFNSDEYLGLGRSHPRSYRNFMEQKLFEPLRKIDPKRAFQPKNTHFLNGLAKDPEGEIRRFLSKIDQRKEGIELQVLGIDAAGHYTFYQPAVDVDKDLARQLDRGLDQTDGSFRKIRDLNEFILDESFDENELSSQILEILSMRKTARATLGKNVDLVDRLREVHAQHSQTPSSTTALRDELNKLGKRLHRESETTFYVPNLTPELAQRLKRIVRGKGLGKVLFNEKSEFFTPRARVVNLSVPTILNNSTSFAQLGDVPLRALTLTETVQDAGEIILAAFGEDKADAIRDTLGQPISLDYNSSVLQRHSRTVVIVDQAAAHKIDPNIRATAKARYWHMMHGEQNAWSLIRTLITRTVYIGDRIQAAQELASLGEKADLAVPALIQVLKTHPDPRLQSEVVLALGRIGKGAFPSLLEALRDENGDTRLSATEAIRLWAINNSSRGGNIAAMKQDVAAVIPVLHDLAERDPVAEVQMKASLTLRQIGVTAPPDIRTERFPSQSAIARYQATTNRAKDMKLVIGRDVRETGIILAVEIIKGIQEWRERLGPDENIVIHFATGDTPWLGYVKLAEFLRTWDEPSTKDVLIKYGVSPANTAKDKRPDMNRVTAFPLDSLFPQARTDYHAFPKILNDMFKQLGIPEKNQIFFYGDAMGQEDFEKFISDTKRNGLLLDAEGRITARPGSIQHRVLKAMQRHARNMTKKIESLGGAHIVIAGVGPSYEGQGHVAFMESGTSIDRKAFIGPIAYHVAAGQSKENGGMDRLHNKDKKPRFGFITFGWHELLYRKGTLNDRSDAVKVIAIATGAPKSVSVQKALETADPHPDKPVTPLTGFQKSRGVFIVDTTAGKDLRIFQSPWEFERAAPLVNGGSADALETEELKRFFIRLARDTGKKIRDLVPRDAVPSSLSPELRRIAEDNLADILSHRTWHELRDSVATAIEDGLVTAEELGKSLNLKRGDRIVLISPHLDDDFLAGRDLIRAWTKEYNVSSYYLTKGFTAVHDSYAAAALETLGQYSPEFIDEVRRISNGTRTFEQFEAKVKNRQAALLEKLVQTLRAQSLHQGQPADDYRSWTYMSEAERKIRANLLFLQLNLLSLERLGRNFADPADPKEENEQRIHEQIAAMKIRSGERLEKALLDTPRKVEALRGFVVETFRKKASWGSTDLEIAQEIKTSLRVVEAQTALISLGVQASQIHDPLTSTWYQPGVVRGTAEEKDIKALMNIFRTEKPDLILVNGEGFPDYGAHSTTEASTIAAVRRLLEEPKSPVSGVKILQYAGVWERIPVQDAQRRVIIPGLEMAEFDREFRNHYPSQAPAAVPDSGVPEPNYFSDEVRNNAHRTREETDLLVDVPAKYRRLFDDPGTGILNYKLLDIHDKAVVENFDRRGAEMQRVRAALNKLREESLHGRVPSTDVLSMTKELQAAQKSGLPSSSLLNQSEKLSVLSRALSSRKKSSAAIQATTQYLLGGARLSDLAVVDFDGLKITAEKESGRVVVGWPSMEIARHASGAARWGDSVGGKRFLVRDIDEMGRVLDALSKVIVPGIHYTLSDDKDGKFLPEATIRLYDSARARFYDFRWNDVHEFAAAIQWVVTAEPAEPVKNSTITLGSNRGLKLSLANSGGKRVEVTVFGGDSKSLPRTALTLLSSADAVRGGEITTMVQLQAALKTLLESWKLPVEVTPFEYSILDPKHNFGKGEGKTRHFFVRAGNRGVILTKPFYNYGDDEYPFEAQTVNKFTELLNLILTPTAARLSLVEAKAEYVRTLRDYAVFMSAYPGGWLSMGDKPEALSQSREKFRLVETARSAYIGAIVASGVREHDDVLAKIEEAIAEVTEIGVFQAGMESGAASPIIDQTLARPGARLAGVSKLVRTGFVRPEGQAKNFFTNDYHQYTLSDLLKDQLEIIPDEVLEAIRGYLAKEQALKHIKSFVVTNWGGTDIDFDITHNYGKYNASVQDVIFKALRAGLDKAESMGLLKQGVSELSNAELSQAVHERATPEHSISERGSESVGRAKILGGLGAVNVKLLHEYAILGSTPLQKLGSKKAPGFVFMVRRMDDIENANPDGKEWRFEISRDREIKDKKTGAVIKRLPSVNESIQLLQLASQPNDYVITAVYPAEGSSLPANEPIATVPLPVFSTRGKPVINPTILIRLQSGADAVGGAGSIMEAVNFVPGGPNAGNFVATKPVSIEEGRRVSEEGKASVIYYGWQSHINGRIPDEQIVDHIGVNPPGVGPERRLSDRLSGEFSALVDHLPSKAPHLVIEEVEPVRASQDSLFTHAPKESEPDPIMADVEARIQSSDLVRFMEDKADMGGTWGHTQVPTWMTAIYKASMLEAAEKGEIATGNTFGSLDYDRIGDNENWGIGDDGHMWMWGDKSPNGLASHKLSFKAFTRAYLFSSANKLPLYGEAQDFLGAEAKRAKDNPYQHAELTPRFLELLRKVMPLKYLNLVLDTEDGKGPKNIIERVEEGQAAFEKTGKSIHTLQDTFSGNVSQQGIGSAGYDVDVKTERTFDVLAGDKMGPSALNPIIHHAMFNAVDAVDSKFANGLVVEIWDAKAFDPQGNIALNDIPKSFHDVESLSYKKDDDKKLVEGSYENNELKSSLSTDDLKKLATVLKRNGYVPAKRIFLDAKADREAIVKYLADSDRFNVKRVWSKKYAGWNNQSPAIYLDRPILGSSVTRLGILTGGEYVGKDDPVMVGHTDFMKYVREFMLTTPVIIQGDMNGSHWLWAVPTALKYSVATKDSHPIFTLLRYHISEDGKFTKVEDLTGEPEFDAIRERALQFNHDFKIAQLGGQMQPLGTHSSTVEASYDLLRELNEMNRADNPQLTTNRKNAGTMIGPDLPPGITQEVVKTTDVPGKMRILSDEAKLVWGNITSNPVLLGKARAGTLTARIYQEEMTRSSAGASFASIHGDVWVVTALQELSYLLSPENLGERNTVRLSNEHLNTVSLDFTDNTSDAVIARGIANGATEFTTNPFSVATSLVKGTDPALDELLKQAPANLRGRDLLKWIYWNRGRQIANHPKLVEFFEQSKGRHGWVSVEVDPTFAYLWEVQTTDNKTVTPVTDERGIVIRKELQEILGDRVESLVELKKILDADAALRERVRDTLATAILEEAKQISAYAPNIAVKIGNTRGLKEYLGEGLALSIGLRVLEEATALGISTNFTLIFGLVDGEANQAAWRRGYLRAKAAGLVNPQRPVRGHNSYFVSRIEPYTLTNIKDRAVLNYAQGLIGLLTTLEAYLKGFSGERTNDPAIDDDQNLIIASLANKLKGPADHYMSAFIGGGERAVLTIPEDVINGFNENDPAKVKPDLDVAKRVSSALGFQQALIGLMIPYFQMKDRLAPLYESGYLADLKSGAISPAEAAKRAVREYLAFQRHASYRTMLDALSKDGDTKFALPFAQAITKVDQSRQAAARLSLAAPVDQAQLPMLMRQRLTRPFDFIGFDQDDTLTAARQRLQPETRDLLLSIANNPRAQNVTYFADVSAGDLEHLRTYVSRLLPEEVRSRWYEGAAMGALIIRPDGTELNNTPMSGLGQADLDNLATIVRRVIGRRSLEQYDEKWTINFAPGHEELIQEIATKIREKLPIGLVEKGLNMQTSSIAIDFARSHKPQALQRVADDIAQKLGTTRDKVLGNTIFFGDSENDVHALNLVQLKGGVAVFVGQNLPKNLSHGVFAIGKDFPNTKGVNAVLAYHAQQLALPAARLAVQKSSEPVLVSDLRAVGQVAPDRVARLASRRDLGQPDLSRRAGTMARQFAVESLTLRTDVPAPPAPGPSGSARVGLAAARLANAPANRNDLADKLRQVFVSLERRELTRVYFNDKLLTSTTLTPEFGKYAEHVLDALSNSNSFIILGRQSDDTTNDITIVDVNISLASVVAVPEIVTAVGDTVPARLATARAADAQMDVLVTDRSSEGVVSVSVQRGPNTRFATNRFPFNVLQDFRGNLTQNESNALARKIAEALNRRISRTSRSSDVVSIVKEVASQGKLTLAPAQASARLGEVDRTAGLARPSRASSNQILRATRDEAERDLNAFRTGSAVGGAATDPSVRALTQKLNDLNELLAAAGTESSDRSPLALAAARLADLKVGSVVSYGKGGLIHVLTQIPWMSHAKDTTVFEGNFRAIQVGSLYHISRLSNGFVFDESSAVKEISVQDALGSMVEVDLVATYGRASAGILEAFNFKPGQEVLLRLSSNKELRQDGDQFRGVIVGLASPNGPGRLGLDLEHLGSAAQQALLDKVRNGKTNYQVLVFSGPGQPAPFLVSVSPSEAENSAVFQLASAARFSTLPRSAPRRFIRPERRITSEEPASVRNAVEISKGLAGAFTPAEQDALILFLLEQLDARGELETLGKPFAVTNSLGLANVLEARRPAEKNRASQIILEVVGSNESILIADPTAELKARRLAAKKASPSQASDGYLSFLKLARLQSEMALPKKDLSVPLGIILPARPLADIKDDIKFEDTVIDWLTQMTAFRIGSNRYDQVSFYLAGDLQQNRVRALQGLIQSQGLSEFVSLGRPDGSFQGIAFEFHDAAADLTNVADQRTLNLSVSFEPEDLASVSLTPFFSGAYALAASHETAFDPSARKIDFDKVTSLPENIVDFLRPFVPESLRPRFNGPILLKITHGSWELLREFAMRLPLIESVIGKGMRALQMARKMLAQAA